MNEFTPTLSVPQISISTAISQILSGLSYEDLWRGWLWLGIVRKAMVVNLKSIVVPAQPASDYYFCKGWRNRCYRNQILLVLGLYFFRKVGEILLFGPKPRLSVQGLSSIATADTTVWNWQNRLFWCRLGFPQHFLKVLNCPLNSCL